MACIRESYPNLQIIETGENLGYAEGNNTGIRHALLSAPDYICVLNNDTVVHSDFLTELVRVMEEDERIGIAGPKVNFFDPSDLIFSAGCDIDWRRGVVTHRRIFQPDILTSPEEGQDVDAIAGCGMLLRREVVETVGLLDSAYYLNYEDIDLCVRAAECGYRIFYVPRSVIYHKVSATLGQDSPSNIYYMTRNGLRFFSHHGPHKGLALARYLLRTLRMIGAWTLKSAYDTESYKLRRKAAFRALSDFLRRRSGPMQSDLTH